MFSLILKLNERWWLSTMKKENQLFVAGVQKKPRIWVTKGTDRPNTTGKRLTTRF
jgi:hypothetical protein